MGESRIGRLLVASLHQAIAELLPTRLEFYENWLSLEGLRGGSIGLAQLYAALSFLRREEQAYGLVTSRAGRYVASWTVDELPRVHRAIVRRLPLGLRMRAAARVARRMIRRTSQESDAVIRVRRRAGSVDVTGSLFCGVREATALPLCGFYEAAIARCLALLDVSVDTHITECRAAGSTKCLISFVVQTQGS